MDSEKVAVELEDQAEAVDQTESNETVVPAEKAETVEAVKPEKVTEKVEAADPTAKAPASGRPTRVEDLKVGMRCKGRVRNVVDFGAFVDVGVGRDGLAHISTLKRAGIDKTVKVGDTLEVQVRRVDLDNNRISLTIPGAEVEREDGDKTSLRDLEVGAMVGGTVKRLVDFGAFVDIGAQTDGLLHISQLPGGFVRHPSDVVKVGDEVNVRILEVDKAKRRISLSMKDDRRANNRQAMAEMRRQQEEESGNDGPTAFEVAWQEALKARKRGRNR